MHFDLTAGQANAKIQHFIYFCPLKMFLPSFSLETNEKNHYHLIGWLYLSEEEVILFSALTKVKFRCERNQMTQSRLKKHLCTICQGM